MDTLEAQCRAEQPRLAARPIGAEARSTMANSAQDTNSVRLTYASHIGSLTDTMLRLEAKSNPFVPAGCYRWLCGNDWQPTCQGPVT